MEEAEDVVFVGWIIEDVCSGCIHGCVDSMDHVMVLRCGNLIEIMFETGLLWGIGEFVVLSWEIFLCARIGF